MVKSLTTVGALLSEAGAVYRAMRYGQIEHDEGRSLVWVLAQMRAMVEAQALERIEKRLDELSGVAIERRAPHGNAIEYQPAHLPH
ncbi:MAG: hypothetical protein GEU91_17820 [Rhizobiales bacterium]|nr:hypothetical protein [Hyphomicrobiales bacterium]